MKCTHDTCEHRSPQLLARNDKIGLKSKYNSTRHSTISLTLWQPQTERAKRQTRSPEKSQVLGTFSTPQEEMNMVSINYFLFICYFTL